MTPEQLMSLSVKELKALAGEKGVPRAAKMRKEELVQALLPHAHGPHPGSPAAKSPHMPPATGTGSSGSSLVAQAPTQAGHPPEHGLPIPDRYGRDRLVLMVQDPQHVFAYWEVTPERYEQVRGQAGDGAAPVLVLTTPNGQEQREVDLRGGNYYLAVAPNATYQAQLALRDRQGRLHALATSNQVTTPAASVSPRTDEQWMAVDETFHELLAMAGLPGGVGSSLARFTDQRLAAWAWKDTGVHPWSSGALHGGLGGILSSHSLSSHSLVSGSGLAALPDFEHLLKR
jgi:hypothetical protein